MAKIPAPTLPWLCLFGLVSAGIEGCNGPESPGCLMRGGDWVEVVEVYEVSPRELILNNHMNVVVQMWDSAATQLVWSGPENILAYRWSLWDGDALELGHEDRCQWMRDLGANVGLTVRAPDISKFALHGQGRFDALMSNADMAVTVDAHAYAGYVMLECELDSLTVRLHAGACSARAEGTVGTLSLFASGLSGVDAKGVQAQRVFVNQSAHPVLRFQAEEYAYVALNSHSNAVGTLPMPEDYYVVRNGSGQLIWEE